MSRRQRGLTVALAAGLFIAGAALVAVGIGQFRAGSGTVAPAGPAGTPEDGARSAPTATEPILPPPPTATAEPTAPPPPTATLSATAAPATRTAPRTPRPTQAAATTPATPTSSPTPTPPAAATAARQPGLFTLRQRLGVCAPASSVGPELAERLGFGWYLDWGVNPASFQSGEVEYVPMIRVPEGRPALGGQELQTAVDALPGALWLIGNEPDVRWQDNAPPEAYAQAYHDLYGQLKALDPTCQVAIGGVSQPTPLRLRYLDRILEAYQTRYGEAMPVDVWNVHNFVLREERDSWGVDIPPGLADDAGVLREIADHDSIEIFRRQIVDFRRWMAQRGQQDKPLIVTEYGVLMPADYGFPPQQVERFMLATFDFFATAVDPDLGYPADGYRLVQRWAWFSLSDARYPTGDLVSPDGTPTSLGEALALYARRTR